VVPLSSGAAYGTSGTDLGTDCPTVGSSSPLHVAAEHGHITTVAALLAAGANVNLRDTVRTQNPPPAFGPEVALHWLFPYPI
jgi:hypothetical protein